MPLNKETKPNQTYGSELLMNIANYISTESQDPPSLKCLGYNIANYISTEICIKEIHFYTYSNKG